MTVPSLLCSRRLSPSLSVLLPSSSRVRFWRWILETMYWIHLGKEAPSSLCPLGFSISCLFNTLCSLVGLNFDSDSSLCMHEIVMVLWALCSESEPSCLVHIIQDSRAPSNRSSWAFHVFEKTPFLLTKPAIPPKPWSDSSIPFVDVFTSPLWSCLQNLVRFGLDLIPRTLSFGSSREENRVSGLRLNFYLTPIKPTLEFEVVGSTGE
jgi:hypothetical protein